MRLSSPDHRPSEAALVRAGVLVVAAGVVFALRPDPWTTPSALGLEGAASLACSLLAGAIVAGLFVVYTRFAAARFAFARQLTADLRRRASTMTPLAALGIAVSASLGEELVFRSLLVPWCGVLIAAGLFGLVHLRSGIAFALVAAAFGLALGAVFVVSGHLAGPLVAHFVVDAVALLSARSTGVAEASSTRTPLRGLLGAHAKAR
ncbi:MAG TPA: CPBP family intramembrane glutamic endopeptidase [Polyangiaceae bacterium]